MAGRLIEIGRWIMEPELLPEPEESSSTQQKTRTSLQWLRSSDRLPQTGEPVRQNRGFISWLAGREDLGVAPAVTESTPQSPLRWIFSGDALERLNDVKPTKEVPTHGP
jgi:hypothetical protein